ncbi:ribokinase [Devosia sp. CN2-171]|uniref:ribokinase n=1 Tax=Devosia sp. CN2-171 TaxID=3400909 RepID=UPI003BF86790
MITVLGSTNLDLIGTVSRIPKPGETVPGDKFSMAAGGKGANQALAARRAGAEVRMFAAAGTDSFADEALKLLRADGVDLSHVRIVDGPTGIAMIFVDEAGENVIAILPGANGTMSPADADAALAGLGIGSVLMLQQEIPQAATERALELARGQGVVSILNTAPFLKTTRAVAEQASIVIANETEFELLTGAGVERLDAAMADWARAQNQTVIVTLGPDGARAATPTGSFRVPALKVEPVDTVGAGDTFCGYLAAGLDQGLDLEAAMQRAAVAASLAVLKPGAQPAVPYAADVEKALKS